MARQNPIISYDSPVSAVFIQRSSQFTAEVMVGDNQMNTQQLMN